MIRIALFDDSVPFYNHIKQCLKKYGAVCHEPILILYYSSAEELLFSYQCQYDIIVLDPLSGKESGFELAKSIRRMDERVFLIFCSASRDFGPESYQVRASNYLLKPVSYKSLAQTMDLLRIDLLKLKSCIIAHSAEKLTKIPLDDILYVTYSNHKLNFHLIHKTEAESYGSYKSLLEQPGAACLYQIHKSIVVGLLWIERVDDKTVYLKDIPQGFLVSKQRWKSFLRSYQSLNPLISGDSLPPAQVLSRPAQRLSSVLAR